MAKTAAKIAALVVWLQLSPIHSFVSPSWSHSAVSALGSTRSSPQQTEPMPWTVNSEKYGDFDQEQDWAWAYSTTPEEACTSYVCDDIEGTIPDDIAGTFYKTGPANFEREGRRYDHVLDGDGFVAALSFENNQVKYTGRFVETEYYQKEKETDTILYRNVFGTQRKGGFLTNAFDLTLKNVANTNVLQWGDRLFVLWEAGRPYELDPETLETLPLSESGPLENMGGGHVGLRGVTIDDGGPMDQAMKFGRSFTAHPHIEDDNTLVAFKFAQSPLNQDGKMEFLEYDGNWNTKSSVQYNVPECASGPHDFALSRDYYVFFQNRFGLDNLPFLLGMKAPTQVMQLLLNEPTVLHLVPRSPGKPALQLELPTPYFNIHMVAKIEQRNDNKLVIYSNGWDLTDERFFTGTSVPFLGSWGGPFPDFLSGTVPPAHLFRTVVDLTKEQVESHEQVLPGMVMEFPIQDERMPQHVYCGVATTDNTSLPTTGLAKIDVMSNTAEYWWAEGKIFTNEAVAIPKRNGGPGSWLLTLLYDAAQKRTSLAIFDSESLSNGPVCRIHLKYRLTYGLHGSFAEASSSIKKDDYPELKWR